MATNGAETNLQQPWLNTSTSSIIIGLLRNSINKIHANLAVTE